VSLNRLTLPEQPTGVGVQLVTADDADANPPTGQRPSDAILVAAARAGEGWAREALFRRHARLATGLAYRLLGSDADLEDVVQEAYLQALRSLHRLVEPQAFASWLAGIVVRRVQQMLRRRRLLTRLGLRPSVPVDPDLSLSTNAPPEVVAELRSIYSVLDSISTQARLVLLLRRVDGYTMPEIATMLDCSLSTVKRRSGEAERVLAARERERS
jgi:RNA polymerase sigma-70 factor (ECF subfamily)